MTLDLREVTSENFRECVNLKVADSQKTFVASNVMSIAQSKVSPYLIPLAVYNGDEMVGFTLHGKDPNDEKYYIVRLMIDEKFQGNGYGKQATLELIEIMGRYEDCDSVYLYVVPENLEAERLYANLGFKRTGKIDEDDGEIEMKLDVGMQRHARK